MELAQRNVVSNASSALFLQLIPQKMHTLNVQKLHDLTFCNQNLDNLKK